LIKPSRKRKAADGEVRVPFPKRQARRTPFSPGRRAISRTVLSTAACVLQPDYPREPGRELTHILVGAVKGFMWTKPGDEK
jgi:hypothetical protein